MFVPFYDLHLADFPTAERRTRVRELRNEDLSCGWRGLDLLRRP